jgi:GNAT superfamily N-acetyltransferase
VTLRPATEADVAVVLRFIRDLSVYEKLEHLVVATEDDLRRWLFGRDAVAEVVLAFEGDEAAGFALFFRNFSTFLGRPGIYLEDLFVREASRGRGIGTSLLTHLAGIARERGYGRVEWAVLDWNQPAIDFYRSLGATLMDDWRICRLTGEALDALADDNRRP